VTDQPLSRFLELCAREMDAVDVRAEPRGTAEPSPSVLVATLGESTEVVVTFAEPPADVDARRRRLEMLATAFASAFERRPEKPRREGRRSLRGELEALAARAGAIDAVVIDAHSPIVWGASGPMASPMANVIPLKGDAKERVERIHESHRDLMAMLEGDVEPTQDNEPSHPPQDTQRRESRLSLRAVAEVRALPTTAALHKGGHLAYANRGDGYGVVARSFAAIYVLILVFDKAFDEIRAERALREGLPVIERLVLALPPMDPEPGHMAGVIALRRPRKRR
jgi:hypothetical protein